MKALSVKQPWAHCIIHLGKSIENRTWYTGHRGVIAIHASKTKPTIAEIRECAGVLAEVYPDRFPRINDAHVYLLEMMKDKSVFGSVIGFATLDSVGGKYEDNDSLWKIEGQYGFHLTHTVDLETPIPAKGQLGLWEWDQ